MSKMDQHIKKVGKFLARKAPVISTTVGVVGVLGVAVLSSQASVKAYEVLTREERYREAKKMEPMEVKDKLALTWKYYAPVVLCTVATIAAIVTLNRVGERRAASAAALYAMSEAAFREYRDHVVEHMGEEKDKEIKSEITQKHVEENPPKSEIVLMGEEVLLMDGYSGRYFKGNVEDIRSYVNDINQEVISSMYASLTEFYDMIGLERTSYSDEVGWNSDNLLEVEFVPAMAPNNKPCLVIEFTTFPVTGYDRNY